MLSLHDAAAPPSTLHSGCQWHALHVLYAQEKNEALRAAAAAASKGGTANEARLQDREAYIASLQARVPARALCTMMCPSKGGTSSCTHMRALLADSMACMHVSSAAHGSLWQEACGV